MPGAGNIALIVRYDDFFSPEPNVRSTQELRRTERALARIHQRRNLPAVFGVVPAGIVDGRDESATIDAMVLACGAGSEVALHGYRHENTLTPPRSRLPRAWARFCQRTRSEFAGLPLEEQDRRIGAGLARLEMHFALPVTTFVPPWNAYDHNTVEACRRHGIRTLSASRAWPVPQAAGMTMVPQTVGADHLEGAVEFALRRRRPVAVVCVTHVWDFADSGQAGYITLEDWDTRLNALAADRRIVVTTLNRIHDSIGTVLTAARLRRHRVAAAALRLAARLGPARAGEVRRASYPLD